MRSPSGWAVGTTRGVAPVAMSTTSAVRVWVVPSARVASTSPGATSRPVPASTVTPSAARRAPMSRDCAAASARIRRLTAVSSATESETSSPSWSSRCTPRSDAVSNWLMKSAVEMRVLDGHAVGEHRGTADAVPVDHGHGGTEVGGDERGLVATGAAAEDHYGGFGRIHAPIQPSEEPSPRSVGSLRA